MSNIFISYKREQRDWVRKLVTLLESYGLTVWWDPKIEVGEEYFKVINKIIADVDCIVVIWSHDSIDSPWVISEASVGMERNNMIPILLDDVSPPIPFNILQSANLVNWNGEKEHEGIEHLLSSIQKYCALTIEEKKFIKEEAFKEEEKAYFFTKPSENRDTKEWKRVLKDDSKSSYKRYLKDFPEGKHHKKARKKLRTLAFQKQMIMSLFIIGVLIVLIVVKKVGG